MSAANMIGSAHATVAHRSMYGSGCSLAKTSLRANRGEDAMYCETNFKTKKQLVEAFKRGETLRVYSPGPFESVKNGVVCVEGPHYPEPHRWYATATIANGVITKVR
jgi:hypothetical protein